MTAPLLRLPVHHAGLLTCAPPPPPPPGTHPARARPCTTRHPPGTIAATTAAAAVRPSTPGPAMTMPATAARRRHRNWARRDAGMAMTRAVPTALVEEDEHGSPPSSAQSHAARLLLSPAPALCTLPPLSPSARGGGPTHAASARSSSVDVRLFMWEWRGAALSLRAGHAAGAKKRVCGARHVPPSRDLLACQKMNTETNVHTRARQPRPPSQAYRLPRCTPLDHEGRTAIGKNNKAAAPPPPHTPPHVPLFHSSATAGAGRVAAAGAPPPNLAT